MASMTIRNLDEGLKVRLRIKAAQHNRSMEEEARDILRAALSTEVAKQPSLVSSIRTRVGDGGGVDICLPTREPIKTPPDFL